MTELAQCDCEACKIGAPLASEAERQDMMSQIPDWEIVTVDNIDRLIRRYKFNNFVDAMVFTNAIAELAETQGHHPALLTEWGSVEVSWWSHKIKGLHKNDFVMAARSDQLYG